MSVLLMAQVWKSPLPAGQKIVLLALADNCNDQGICYPSISTIAEKCSISERSVFNHIDSFKRLNIITCESRTGRSTIYTLHPCNFCTPATVAPLQPLHPTPATVAPLTINEPSIEPPIEPSVKVRAKPAPKQSFKIIEVPAWLDSSDWILWQKSKNKKSSVDQQIKQLQILSDWRDSGIDYQYALRYSATNGYQGIFEPKTNNQNKTRIDPRSFEAHQAAAQRSFAKYGNPHPQQAKALEVA
jgi:Helix-turn-helix domain